MRFEIITLSHVMWHEVLTMDNVFKSNAASEQIGNHLVGGCQKHITLYVNSNLLFVFLMSMLWTVNRSRNIDRISTVNVYIVANSAVWYYYITKLPEVLGFDLDLSLRFIVLELSIDGNYAGINVLLLNLIKNSC